MSRFTKVLVALGATAMVAVPAIASAAGSTLPAMASGTSEEDNDVDGLLIGGGVALIGGVLVLISNRHSASH